MADRFQLHHGDTLAVLCSLPDGAADSIVCDPPYGINLRPWDKDVPALDVWREARRVVRPGGAVLAFGHARTYHRLATRAEDAGLYIDNSWMWLYGTGKPPAGHRLKPAHEPIMVAWNGRGPGRLRVDDCRVPGAGAMHSDQPRGGWNMPSDGTHGVRQLVQSEKGRHPATVMHDGSETVVALFPETPGTQRRPIHKAGGRSAARHGEDRACTSYSYDDEGGSAARYFYSAKPKGWERDHAGSHPSPKPLELCRQIVRLVTPPGGTVLDLYCGSGSIPVAAFMEGMDTIAIDSDASSIATTRRRLEWAAGGMAGEAA